MRRRMQRRPRGRARGPRAVGAPARLLLLAVIPLLADPGGAGAAASGSTGPGDLLHVSEGNRMRRLDVDTVGTAALAEQVLIERAADARNPGDPTDPQARVRDVNGMVCPLPDGSGRFVAGEDTGQPSPPAGWGVFDPGGTQVGKLTATYLSDGPEPFGCAFHPNGTLFTTEVGEQGFLGLNGQLVVWFPPFDVFPGPPGAYPDTSAASTHFCKIDVGIGNATGIAIDDEGRVYVSSANTFQVLRFTGPFPTSVADCTDVDPLGSPMAVGITRETFLNSLAGGPVAFYTGLTISPWNTLVAASVVNGLILEYDLEGQFLRTLLEPATSDPPIPTGHPQDVVFDRAGNLYYSDLDLHGTLPDVSPGPDGKLWRIRFDPETEDPRAPELVKAGLAFPDGLGVLPGDLEPREWRTYGGGPERRGFNAHESIVTPDNVDELQTRWRFPTGAIVTAPPVVARIPLGGAVSPVVYVQSWDGNVYALHAPTGAEIWRFETTLQPGATFPHTGAAHVASIDDRETVFIGAGETLYALDAATGSEIWHFEAGTGCRDADGNPPGLCGFGNERNEIESSPLVMDGKVFFGMDVNDVATGKGGFYALDARNGRLVWFFDLESGSTCRPLADDDVRRFDGYHSEAELGLPAGFFATRPGCDFPRSRNGCGNVWSSPAGDVERNAVYFASSNCDTDDDPATGAPPPPMPPYDEAIVALSADGGVLWRWRPREVDNDDLAFGAVPNLFAIEVGGQRRDVVGVGNKDGTYYVVDRDGVNVVSGVRWDDDDPSGLPYWATQVVPGGPAGGIIGSAAIDGALGRVYLGTAPGDNPFLPQTPTQHALDLNTGAVVWTNDTPMFNDATFAATTALRGVVFQGAVLTPRLRAYRTDGNPAALGSLLLDLPVNPISFGSALASAPAVVDGLVIVGGGIGARSSNAHDASDATSRIPTEVVALCVRGTPTCPHPTPCGSGFALAGLVPPVLLGTRRRRR